MRPSGNGQNHTRISARYHGTPGAGGNADSQLRETEMVILFLKTSVVDIFVCDIKHVQISEFSKYLNIYNIFILERRGRKI